MTAKKESNATLPLVGHRCQCTACGEYFNHEYGFDKHRVGKSTNGSRRCLPASEMVTKGFSKNLKGFWITEAHTSARIASARQGHSPSGAAQS